MSKKANPAAIGIFVVGAIVLAVIGTVVFGSGKLFRKTEQIIMYFDDSINGLDAGAPLKFKGVKIGQVSQIYISHNQKENYSGISVIVEVDTERLQSELGVNVNLGDAEELRSQVTSLGLRARLQQESYVTGLLYIELDYYDNPGRPSYGQDPNNPIYLEIPTIDSEFTAVLQTAVATLNNVSKIDFKRISDQAQALLSEIQLQVEDLRIRELNNEALSILGSLREILNDPQLRLIFENVNQSLAEGRVLVSRVDGQIDPLMSDIAKTTEQTRITLAAFESFAKNADKLVDSNSPLQSEIIQLLSDMRESAKTLKLFLDFIERNPNAFLTGKQAYEPQ